MNSWKDNVRRVAPYTPGEQPKTGGFIKLNTNENPYPPAPGVQKLAEELASERLRLYPDADSSKLCKALADYYGFAPENIFAGVGSDDVLGMAFMTFFNSDKPVLFPKISYSFYPVWAEMLRIPYECTRLADDYHLIVEDFCRENGGIVIANPNAPTSLCEPLSVVRDILEHNPDSVVIVDEAYVDFGGESALPLLAEFPNLLVVRTFSKSRSMAGLRIGFAIGSAEMIGYLNDVKNSYNSYTMNYYAQALGEESVREDEYFRETLRKVVETREWAAKELAARGFSFPKSSTNFLFVTHPEISAKDLFVYLKEHKVLVRYFATEELKDRLRITVGTPEEMQALLDVIDEYRSK